MSSRREFIQKSLLAGIGVSVLGKSILNATETQSRSVLLDGKYTLPPLPYAYNALEPWIDEKTMQIHHDKHHQAYVDNLNKALDEEKKRTDGNAIKNSGAEVPQAPIPDGEEAPAEISIWADLEDRFKTISTAPAPVRNNGGGHWNHSFFWEIMMPFDEKNTANTPSGKLLDDLNKTFGSVEKFKELFNQAAKDRFGSGWAWLIKKEGQLMITSTANQDNPLMDVAEAQGRPILGLDVWEHAYYLKYQNVRGDYIKNWWNVVNWERVNKHYLKA